MNTQVLFRSILTATIASLCITLPAFARPAVLTAKDADSQINVRSAPSTRASSSSYGVVGDRVEVLSSEKGNDGYTWYYVKFSSNVEGWVREDFISFPNTSKPTVSFARPKPAILVGAEPGSQVNVRTKPSLQASSPSYGVVGDRVTALRSAYDQDGAIWYYVRFISDAEGWVRGDFVRLIDQ